MRFTISVLLGLLACVAQADIVHGTNRADVIAELGKPTSTARRGAREILQYPKGMRLELEEGVVVDLRGYVSDGTAPSGPVVPPVEEPAASGAKSSDAVATKNSVTPPPAMREDFSPAAAAHALGDEVEKMGTAWGGVTAPTHIATEKINWLELGLRLALRFAFTVIALRLAFKYWEMDAFWKGTFAIAGIDGLIHGVMEALGPASGGFTTLGGVENAVPWAVMIFTIRHFCFNKRLQNAVLTAGAVKVVVLLCDVFLSIALLNAIF